MLNLLLNNETAKNLGSLPFLTNNTIWKGDSIMTNQSISKPKRICQVEGCLEKHHAKGYCNRHYYQILRYGRIRRTVYDPNKIISLKNAHLIVLVNVDYSKYFIAIIDKEDIDKIKNYRWSVTKTKNTPYAQSTKKDKLGTRTCILMHRIIMNAQKGQEIDHKNRNGLDNRKENLRFCTRQQNRWNSKKQNRSISLYKGVSWNKVAEKWQAFLCVNYKNKSLGYFDNQADAAIAYNNAAVKCFGEFAMLNII